MKRFVFKTFVFYAIILFLIVIAISFINSISRQNSNFKTKQKSSYAVFGNSHPECAFNDSLIDDLTNLASSGEAYFYTYFKAKNIIENNKDIHTVFIEFSYTGINKASDEWIWTDKYLSKRFDEYGPFMTFKDYHVLFSHNRQGFIKYLTYSTKKNLKRILSNQQHFEDEIGGYRFLDKELADSTKKNFLESKPIKVEKFTLSNTNKKYLLKTVNYFKGSGVKVYFIKSPTYNYTIRTTVEVFLQDILNTKFKHVELLDFSKFPLEASDFFDNGHLNYKGAKKFSIWFDSLLKKGFLDLPSKQVFIDRHIELMK